MRYGKLKKIMVFKDFTIASLKFLTKENLIYLKLFLFLMLYIKLLQSTIKNIVIMVIIVIN